MNDNISRRNITDKLEFEPSIDAADIGAAVENGVVTLTGHVPTGSPSHEFQVAERRSRRDRHSVNVF